MRLNDSTSSGLKTGSQQIFVGPGSLHGIDVIAPSSGVNFVKVRDNFTGTAEGLELAFVEADAGMVSINHEFFTPVVINNGLYIEVTGSGTNCQYILRYARG